MKKNVRGQWQIKWDKSFVSAISFFVWVLFMFSLTSKVLAHGENNWGMPHQDNPRGLTIVDWQHAQISRLVTAGYPDSFGLFAFNGRRTPTTQIIAGKHCIESHFLAFDINDDLAWDTQVDLKVRLLIAAKQSGSLILGYDKHGEVDASVVFEAPSTVESDEQGLSWVEVVLPDARLFNRGISGTDLALTTLETMKLPAKLKPEDKTTFVLCDIQLSGFESGQKRDNKQRRKVVINFLEAGSELVTPVRFGLYDLKGSQQVAHAGVIDVPYYEGMRRILSLRDNLNPEQFWPHSNRYYQYTSGKIELQLPAGMYQLVASKGPEFQIVNQILDVSKDATDERQVTLKRHANWQNKGWYSGDVHIHMNRQFNDEADLLSLAQAEDLHLTNLLAMSNIGEAHYPQPAYGGTGRVVQQNQPESPLFALVPGIESPRTAFRGHALSLNIDALRPVDGDYYLYHKYFSHYHAQGAVNGYAHIGSEEFNGSWGLALDVPFGLVDFVEIMQNSKLRTELWYEQLNLGQKLAPAAGSDFPYFDQPGAVRVYAKPDKNAKDHVDAWFEGLRVGRTFITNGPLIDFQIDNNLPGDSVPFQPTYKLSLEIALAPAIDKLETIELMHCGKVLARFPPPENGELSLSKNITIPTQGWLAIRVKGRYSALAHTGAIYLTDSNGLSHCKSTFLKTIETMLARLEQLDKSLPKKNKELEYWESQSLLRQFQAQRNALRERIRMARTHYLEQLQQTRILKQPDYRP